MRSIM